MMAQMLSGDSQQQGTARDAGDTDLGSVLARELSPDEAARWMCIIQSDLQTQNSAEAQEPLSEAYVAGEGFVRRAGLNGLLADWDNMEEDKNGAAP